MSSQHYQQEQRGRSRNDGVFGAGEEMVRVSSTSSRQVIVQFFALSLVKILSKCYGCTGKSFEQYKREHSG